jgi:protein tyrosine/serine phosphatase
MMVCAKPVWSFLFLVLAGIAGACVARQSAAPSPHQYALAEKMAVFGIKDFGKVNEYLYRGAQPKEEGIEELKKLGIDTIVDLRGERHGLMEKERAHAESLGMRLVSIPGTGWTAPRDEQIAQFFSLASETPRRKIFVHCWFGGDRDGMFVAAYRIAFDGWTAEEAVREMRAFHYKEFMHPNMKWYVRKFPERLAKSPVLASHREMPKRTESGPAPESAAN